MLKVSEMELFFFSTEIYEKKYNGAKRERWDEWMGNEVENILFFDDAVYCYNLLLDGHKHKAKEEEESNLWK